MRAVLFVDGAPEMFLSGSLRQLNANVAAGRTWREIAPEIRSIEDVPPLAELPPHPELRAVSE